MRRNNAGKGRERRFLPFCLLRRKGASLYRKAACLLAVVLPVLALSGCSGPERFTASFLGAFDTAASVVGYAGSQAEFDAYTARFEELLLEYSRLYDIYTDYDGLHNLKTVNDNAGGAPVEVDSRIIDLLSFGKEVYEMSDGLVNICFGSVLSLWHDCREASGRDPASAALPDPAQLQEAARHTDIDCLIIDEASSSVCLSDPEARLDVGAIAKGFAVEAVCAQLEQEGFRNASYSVGGNIRTCGWKERKEGEGWVIGLEDPLDPSGDYRMTLALPAGMSLVTSGDYQRYYTVDGVRYHHIIDPTTLYPAGYAHAVSVLAADSGLADALSTWLFLLPVEEGLKLVESMDGVEAVWTALDGRTVESSGFAQYVR